MGTPRITADLFPGERFFLLRRSRIVANMEHIQRDPLPPGEYVL